MNRLVARRLLYLVSGSDISTGRHTEICVSATKHAATSMRSQQHCSREKPSLLHCETLRHTQRRVTRGVDWQHKDRNALFEYGGVLQSFP